MAQGPPPSEAGPSNPGTQQQPLRAAGYAGFHNEFQAPSISAYTAESANANSVPAQITHAQYYAHNTGGVHQQSAYGHTPQLQLPTSSLPQFTYHHYSPGNQTSTWPPGAQSSTQQSGYQNQFQATYSPRLAQTHPVPPVQGPQPSSPAPIYNKYWDGAIKSFLQAIGFTQTLRGFQADMLVLNSDWERNKVPEALSNLSRNLEQLAVSKAVDMDEPSGPPEQSLDKRKLEYAHFVKGIEPRTPTSVTKSIFKFLAQNRARNDASNRNEFLLSLPEKRRRLEEIGLYDASNGPVASCARTDAKTQNRDLQMKYDIAKNEDGPLRKTMKSPDDGIAAKADVPLVVKAEDAESVITGERYPAFDERLQNLEAHLAVRYVPSPPRSLLDRLKFLEDHLTKLEKEYPPWAALHFNQPHRGWPPPPRPTPIIVPSHLTSSTASTDASQPSILSGATSPIFVQHSFAPITADEPKSKGKQSGRNAKSSLHRAVMERLEVQKAMDDLAGVRDRESG